jgi:hypothetical protein
VVQGLLPRRNHDLAAVLFRYSMLSLKAGAVMAELAGLLPVVVKIAIQTQGRLSRLRTKERH